MTYLTDDWFCPRPHTGQGLHTQESGDYGLSSNMEHRFSEIYSESDFPIADKSSFVRPIPKEENNMTHPIISVRQNSKTVSMMPKSQSEYAEEGLLKPSIPQATPIPLSDKVPEEATVNTLARSTTITEEQPDAEMAEDGGIVNIYTSESKGLTLVPEKMSNSNHARKRAAGKKWRSYLLSLAAIAIIVPVSEGFSVQYFACKDKDMCPKLMTIYGPNDTRLYHRGLGQTFPQCSGDPPPTPLSCVVCSAQAEIIVICPKAIGNLEGETSDGRQIFNITFVGEQQQLNGRAPIGLVISSGLFLMVVVGALVIQWLFQP